MPKSLERKLRRAAKGRGYSKERTDRYVYGTITNINKRRKKGQRRG